MALGGSKPEYLTDEEYAKCLLLDIRIHKRVDGWFQIWNGVPLGNFNAMIYCDTNFRSTIISDVPSELIQMYIEGKGRWLR
jgi:hypothetical protein